MDISHKYSQSNMNSKNSDAFVQGSNLDVTRAKLMNMVKIVNMSILFVQYPFFAIWNR